MPEPISPEQLAAMRHTAAHILAAASMKLRPDTKLGVGPAIDDGFYHDIDVSPRYTEEDIKALQKEMERIKKMNLPIEQREVSKEEARKLFANDPYKLELIEEIPGDSVGISDMGHGFFVTLCGGGHAASTGQVGAFKLTRLAGVYWKGDEKNPQLQRVYGVLFPAKEELEAHLKMLAEAKQRDHRKLGKELDLFTFSELVGPGLPLWTPKGTLVRNLLDDFVWELRRAKGYEKVAIPHITKKDLYEKSGHWQKFSNELFKITTREGHVFAMKPMNCPHHTQIYSHIQRSHKELPQRYAETTMCYRDEQTGELFGISRLRSFTQDDAHVFLRRSQVNEEFLKVWDIIDTFYRAVGFGVLAVRLSLRDPKAPEKYLGTPEVWEQAENQLRQIAKERGVAFTESLGEAAFYGPKIDFIAKDSLGREWQVATIQLDFNLPERFDLFCINETGEKERIVMIHAAIMGSIERFLSIFLEHTAGYFPLWLAPVQVAVLPITSDQQEYAQKVSNALTAVGIRVELNDRNETIGKKIRGAQTRKIPVMLIVGKREVEENTVAVRTNAKGDEGAKPLSEVVSQLSEAIAARSS